MEPSSKQFKNDCSTPLDEVDIHEEYAQTSETVIGETNNANILQSFEDLEPKHKVFLSHSGVQKDFVEQLCIDLETCGCYPFFDKWRSSLPICVEFRELIFDAIKQCQVGVLVLSEDFFMKTKWPMLELVAMVRELKREKPRSSIIIIPVFYKLSRQEWLDEENRSIWLSQWEKWACEDERIDIEEWKMALGVLKSFNSLKMDHGEVHLRKEIVEAVCEFALPEIRLYDSHVRGRSRLCKILIEKIKETKQRDGIQVMGLYGIGGIGKTTICKAMCNELFQKFYGKVCHIELNSANEVELLQALLKRFTNIQHKPLEILNIDQCQDRLKRCIVEGPIFLAVDNFLDSQAARRQAKTVLEIPWGRGSIVMVIARGLGELTYFVDEEDCFEMPNLKEDEARSLFLDHVKFGLHSTTEIDEGLLSRCVERCHFSKGEGLGHHYIPLALEVLGKLLGSLGYVPKLWEEQLKKVDAFSPLFSVLRTSYSSLSEEAQMLFMDVALFLPSLDFSFFKYKWNLFDWLRMVHGSGIGEAMSQIFAGLKRRSLLADLGDGRTKVVMHDLWREFCVAEAAITNFEEKRWLFLEEESSVLAECSPGPGSCWRNMRRMCFLNKGWRALNGVQLDDFVNLSVLKVETGSFIPHGSSLELDLKGLKHLKSLDLKTGPAFNIKCLRLGTSVNLAYLRWSNYTTPSPDIEDIGRLSKLQVLDLEGFSGEKLPDLSVLTSLRLVMFAFCHGVATITGLSAKMTRIEFLAVRCCSKLQECPGLGALCALEYLDLGQCHELKEVPCLRLLTRLRVLSIGDCQLLRSVPGLSDLVALEEFCATGCVNLEVLPDLQRLSKLRILKCGSCMALKSFTCTGPLFALESIDLTSCGSLGEMPDLSNFPQLKMLLLGGCTGLTRLTNSAPLRALLVLDLEGCNKVSALPGHLSSSLDLRELRLQRSGILLHESEIRELQVSCTQVVVSASFDRMALQIKARSGFRRRRLRGSVPRDKLESVDRTSNARRGVFSKKTVPTLPLCTVCLQQSPVFGKVKRFTYAELREATSNFSDENYLAKGGHGTVYKGQLKGGQLVAVKQHKLSSSPGDEEFCAEVEVLSCAQHRNLVTLIGYCVEKHMRLLVYEYVCNGSLDRHLCPKSKAELQWHHRHKIALGAASALRYLHEECRVGCIVHRDMRPNNILLTHDFTPMVGDFGLARRQTSGDLAEEILGTIGYLAPECAETGQITDKADVYAFGVVLLELISGRRAIEHNRPKHQVSLTEWARPLLASYDKDLLDPRLKDYNEYELHCMMHAATQCINKDPNKRPRMTQVLRILHPPQERDWPYGPGRPTPENLSSSQAPQPPPFEGAPNEKPHFGTRDSWMEDSVELEEIQRPRLEFKNCYNLLFVIFIFLEPLLSVAGFLNNQGRLLFPLLIQWLRVCAGISEEQVPSHYKLRVKANSLINGRFLGQGCSGIFYETVWSSLRDSTVKLARKLFPGVKGDIFEIEVVRLFELNDHPNIVKTFCWTVDNRSCSLVMQYVRDNLSGVLRKRKEALQKESASKQLVIGTGLIPFQLPEVLKILKQIASGIRHLHDQGITHGDLKPNNVLIDYEDGQILVKLADFGLVETKKRTNLISQRTRCSQIIKWSAPELYEDYFGFMGEDVEFLCKKSLKGSDMTLTSSVSNFENRSEVMMTKADSYSFALTSAYILGGKMWNPNQSENEQLMSAISNGLRPKLPPQCPQSLESLIALCWDAEPLRRPSFSEICQKLEEISAD